MCASCTPPPAPSCSSLWTCERAAAALLLQLLLWRLFETMPLGSWRMRASWFDGSLCCSAGKRGAELPLLLPLSCSPTQGGRPGDNCGRVRHPARHAGASNVQWTAFGLLCSSITRFGDSHSSHKQPGGPQACGMFSNALRWMKMHHCPACLLQQEAVETGSAERATCS